MAVHELPGSVLGSKDAGDPQRNRGHFVASAHLRLESLNLDGVAEPVGLDLRKALELDHPALPVVGGGSLYGLLDLRAPAGRRAEWVGEGGLLGIAVELEEPARVSAGDLIQGTVIRLDGLTEALGRCHLGLLSGNRRHAIPKPEVRNSSRQGCCFGRKAALCMERSAREYPAGSGCGLMTGDLGIGGRRVDRPEAE